MSAKRAIVRARFAESKRKPQDTTRQHDEAQEYYQTRQTDTGGQSKRYTSHFHLLPLSMQSRGFFHKIYLYHFALFHLPLQGGWRSERGKREKGRKISFE
jgi:hypothetical protein